MTTSPAEAAEFIRSGRLAAFPTETVYGLGADVFDAAAVERIFEAKRRPADNPLIAHVGAVDQIPLLARELSRDAERLIERFFPGPLTLVLPRAANVPDVATAGLDTIGVRMPRHDLARLFLTAAATPVAAPSANLSGRPSPTTWQAVLEDLDGRIDCILQGEATEIGLESTVVDCSIDDAPVMLRTGAISLEQLAEVVPSIRIYDPSAVDAPVRSPGLKHRHYSPRARVHLCDAAVDPPTPLDAAYIGVTKPTASFRRAVVARDVDEYARRLFSFFRECDAAGIAEIYCESVDESGIGRALMDRLRRAAVG
ncbi:MAG: L-threonylcarbamoyladenylate synthase [Pyrinomonadaceae bacterium]